MGDAAAVVKKGWLYKLGSDMGLGLGSDLGLAVEQRRYFILRGGRLTYYKTDEEGTRGLETMRKATVGDDGMRAVLSSSVIEAREKNRALKKQLSSMMPDILKVKRASATIDTDDAVASASLLGEPISSFNLKELVAVELTAPSHGRFSINMQNNGTVYLRCDTPDHAAEWVTVLDDYVGTGAERVERKSGLGLKSRGGPAQKLGLVKRASTDALKPSTSAAAAAGDDGAPPPPPRSTSAARASDVERSLAEAAASADAAPAKQWAIESVHITAKAGKAEQAKECSLFWRADLGEHRASDSFVAEVMLIDGMIIRVEHKPNDNDGEYRALPFGMGNTTLMARFSTLSRDEAKSALSRGARSGSAGAASEAALVQAGGGGGALVTAAAVAIGFAAGLVVVQVGPSALSSSIVAYVSAALALLCTPLAYLKGRGGGGGGAAAKAKAKKVNPKEVRRFHLDLKAVQSAIEDGAKSGPADTKVARSRRESLSTSGHHLRRRRAASGAAMPVMAGASGARGARIMSISPRRNSQLLAGLAAGLAAVAEDGGDGADDAEADAGPVEAIVNFSGKWSLDHGASDDPSEQLTALGVPWLARKAIANASRSLEIEQVGWSWRELVSTSIITKETTFSIDGAEHQEVSPIDKSVVSMCTSVEEEGMCIVTRNQYLKQGHSAEVRRWLEDDGRTYHVENTLSMAEGKIICVNNYFRKTD